MKKILVKLVAVSLAALMFVGCSKKEEAAPVKEAEAKTEEVVDVVATASIVKEADALISALSADGFWLAGTLNDVSTTKDIIVDGEFIHKDVVDRKLALYTQDENRKITAQFTLTAPKLIVKSPNFRIQGGTFKGDVYVEAPNFKLDASSAVVGNIYFASQELMDSFVMHETAKFEGTKSVK